MDACINVKIWGKDSEITFTDPDSHSTTTRNVSTGDLGKALINGTAASGMFIPRNCRYFMDTGNSYLLAFETPPVLGVMKYDYRGRNDKNSIIIPDVPYPRGLSVIIVNKTPRGLAFKCLYQYALAKPLTTKNDQLYRWPFSNMYRDNRMCTGGIPSYYQGLEYVSAIPRFVYEGMGNNDLPYWEDWHKTFDGEDTLSGIPFIKKYVQGAPTYPIDRLIQTYDFTTAIESMLSNIRM